MNRPIAKTPKRVTWVILATLVLANLVMYSFQAKFVNMLFFSVAFVWTQSWIFGEMYRERRFRFSFFRLVLELHWLLQRLHRRVPVNFKFTFVPLYFIPPLLFCWGLMLWGGLGKLFFPLLGTVIGAGLLFVFSKWEISAAFLTPRDESETPREFGSEENASEASRTDQSLQTDSD